MQTHVYRSSRRPGLYVYLAEEDGLKRLPAPVLAQLGTPEFAFSFEITPSRKLGQEAAETVIANLERQGFHVQMPRDIETILENISQEAVESSQESGSSNRSPDSNAP